MNKSENSLYSLWGGFKPCVCEFHFFVTHCIIKVETVKTVFFHKFLYSFFPKSFSCVIAFFHTCTKFYIDAIDSFARIVSIFQLILSKYFAIQKGSIVKGIISYILYPCE